MAPPPTSPRRPAAGAVLFALLLMAATASSAAAQWPPPDGSWRTIRTEHFRVTYQPELEPLARHAAGLAERMHAVLRDELAPAPSGVIDIAVTDHVDFTNAFATPFASNRIVLFARPPLDMLELSYARDPIELILAHELTHIFHGDVAGPIGHDVRTVLGRLPMLWPIFPVVGTPLWNMEGLAVHYESRVTGGGRIHGSFHEMVIRTAALHDAIPDLDEVSTPSPVWPAGQRSYIYGGSLMRWLAERHGPEIHREIIAATASAWLPTFLFFDRIARKPTGRDFESHYDEWRQDAYVGARTLQDRLMAEGLTASESVVEAAPFTVHPRLAPAGDHLAFTAADFRSDPATRVATLTGPGVPGDAAAAAVRTLARRDQIGGLLGPASWLPDGSGLVVAQLGYRDPYRIHSDLWRVTLSGDEHRLTDGARLTHPDVAPVGTGGGGESAGDGGANATGDPLIAAIRGDAGALPLVVYDPRSGETRVLGDARPGEGWAAPRWSPDGRHIAAARYVGGTMDVVVVDVATGAVTPLTSDAALDGDPAWSPDGRWVLFWSDRTGIPNLFAAPAVTVAGAGEAGEPGEPGDEGVEPTRIRQVTRVLTGAIQPEVSRDGRWIYLSAYHAGGWRIERMPYDPSSWWDAPASVIEYREGRLPVGVAAEPVPDGAWDDPVAADSEPYRALPTLRPYYWSPFYRSLVGPVTTGDNLRFFGVASSGFDLLRRHHWSADAAYDFGTRRFVGSVYWIYRGLGVPEVGGGLERRYSRAGSLFEPTNAEALWLREDIARADVMLRRLRWRSQSWLTLGGERVWERHEAHESPRAVLEQGGAVDPPGVIGLTAAPGFANFRTHPYSISRQDGIGLSLGGGRWWRADDATRAYDQLQSRLVAYRGLPWWGYADHVLAGRLSALYRAGNDARAASVGGATGGLGPLIGDLVDPLTTGSLFLPIRGFSEGARNGTRAWTTSAEYRYPILLSGYPPVAPDGARGATDPGHGILGFSFTSISGAFFADAGDAWCSDGEAATRSRCSLEAEPILASAGAELSIDFGILSTVPLRLRAGVAVPVLGRDEAGEIVTPYLFIGPSF